MAIKSLKTSSPPTARLVVPLSVKAESIDDTARTFEGLLAVWDLDLGGDVIHKGAFKKTLKDWKGSGDALPLINSHGHYDIFDVVGQLLDAKETDDGLWTKWEVIDGPDGDRVLSRIRPSDRTGRPPIGKMSIGYSPTKFDFEQAKEGPFDRVRNLREVDLLEGSLVIFPMAPGARIDPSTVKQFMEATQNVDPATLDLETKEKLRQLASKIGNLLSKKPAKKDGGVDTSSPSPAAPASTPAEPDPAPTAPTDGDETDVEEVDTDESAETPTPAPASTTPAPTAEPSGTESDGDSKGAVYLYSDALQQRLQSTLLKSKLSQHKEHTA